jgi:hypothetical protein
MPSPPEPLFTPSVSQMHSSQKAEVPDLREKIREQDRRRRLDDAAARRLEKRLEKRLEVRRVKEQIREQQQAVRGEQSRLASLATIEQSRELWRLQDEARALKLGEQKRLRDEAGMRAGGGYKRPVASPQVTEPCAKKRLAGVEDRHFRYIYL